MVQLDEEQPTAASSGTTSTVLDTAARGNNSSAPSAADRTPSNGATALDPEETPMTRTTTTTITSAVNGDDVPEGGNDGNAAGGGDEESQDGGSNREGDDVTGLVARLWKRKDGAKWSDDLRRAFTAFERLKVFGALEWASCVEKFMDFEKACGYGEGSGITTQGRPEVVKRWLARGRKWDVLQTLGELGSEGASDTFIHDWWKWWLAAQPKERGELPLDLCGRPLGMDSLDWTSVVKLHGKNGLLQVMATLLWWGDTVVPMSPLNRMTWVLSVEDVTYTLDAVLKSGTIGKECVN
jgi:hypothetical protein